MATENILWQWWLALHNLPHCLHRVKSLVIARILPEVIVRPDLLTQSCRQFGMVVVSEYIVHLPLLLAIQKDTIVPRPVHCFCLSFDQVYKFRLK